MVDIPQVRFIALVKEHLLLHFLLDQGYLSLINTLSRGKKTSLFINMVGEKKTHMMKIQFFTSMLTNVKVFFPVYSAFPWSEFMR